MSLSKPLVELTVQALAGVLPLTSAADALLRDFFREHHELGQRDRGFVAETIYALLRRRRLMESLCPEVTPRALTLVTLLKLRGISIRELAPVLSETELAWLSAVRSASAETMPPEIAADFPDWLMTKLRATMGEEEILQLARGMQVPAPLDLRVNTMLAKRDAILQQFREQNIEALPTPYSPLGIRLPKKIALNRHELYLSGKVEVQDEGSQLLGLLVAPRRQDMVMDFCAGAGGKTLLLGALMHSQGRLYALDVSQKRLDGLKTRLKRSGLSNVQPIWIDDENDTKVKRLAGKIDRVLLDVPCSGLGTLRRNPDFKWRQQESDIVELAAKQRGILGSAARLVKPGGRLVYATCSILREENEGVVEAFLEANPDYQLESAEAIFAKQNVELKTGQYLHLFPHVHGTDGFFAAAMERKV